MDRPLISQNSVITNGSMATTQTSAVTPLKGISILSYAYVWSGTSPVGTVTVQVSNDYAVSANGLAVTNAGTWNTIPFVNAAGATVTSFAISGNTGNGFVDVVLTGAYAVRTVYTAGSGVGTIQVIANARVS